MPNTLGLKANQVQLKLSIFSATKIQPTMYQYIWQYITYGDIRTDCRELAPKTDPHQAFH